MVSASTLCFTLLASIVAAAPIDNIPATVFFTAMSDSCAEMASYNITSGTCYSYSFTSYLEHTSFDPTTTPCALSIYPETDCQGQGVAATLSQSSQYVTQSGASFELTCGP